jgi:carbonic anhydrase
MDARLDPLGLLGLAVGDAHVIRNAGGAATEDAIRSLSISQHLLGTKEVLVIHHTDCGMQKISDEEFADRVEDAAGTAPPWRALAFSDLEANLRAQVEAIRRSPFLPEVDRVRGFVFDVEDGTLREIGA